jgi:hypothetical protein
MTNEMIQEQLRKEIETKAAALEKRVAENPALEDIRMPDDSYDDLLRRIQEKAEKKKPKVILHKRTILAVSLAAVLVLAVGAGASGAKLFTPKVENKDGDVLIMNEDMPYNEVTEEEAYTEIEEQLGILALRLGYKPDGMELETVYVDAESGEAEMEFYDQEHFFTVYENKQYDGATFNAQMDGEIVDTIELFFLNTQAEIMEVDKGDGSVFYAVQLEQGNAYYYLTSDISLEEFQNTLIELYFKSV